MSKIISFSKRAYAAQSWVSRFCILLCSFSLVVLLIIFGWLVFGRYVLNVTPTWVEQLSLLLVCYITFLGAAAGTHEDYHLGVNFIREALPDFLRKPLRIIVDILMAGFGVVMCYACAQLVQFGWSTDLAMLNIPEGIRTLPAAICGALIFWFASAQAISKFYQYYVAEKSAAEQEQD